MRLGQAISIPAQVLCAALILVAVSAANQAGAAGFITLPGITFTEGSANFRLLAASGQGSLDDPFVVVEEVFGEGEVVLAIDVFSADFGSRVKTMHAVGFALQKVVINRTRQLWDYYALELEFDSGRGSDYYDGLSFAQKAKVNRPFQSDRFATVEDLTEPRDVIRFTQGQVKPGERVRFVMAITHTGIGSEDHLKPQVLRGTRGLQRRIRLECHLALG
ncbi:MAG: hypothetical protein HN732_20810 [Rhodospirillaceae bacterium]|nr:hypothetical protein [Rhodospirillaceae bacterium]